MPNARFQASTIIEFGDPFNLNLLETGMEPDVPQVIDVGAGRGLTFTASPMPTEASKMLSPTVMRIVKNGVRGD